MSLVPDENSAGPDIVYPAEDAVSAIVYAISARLEADPQQAVWAAQVAHDSLDHESFGRAEEERLLAHPLVHAEFQRQQADLSQLEQLAKNPSEEKLVISELQRRAQLDAQVFSWIGHGLISKSLSRKILSHIFSLTRIAK